MLNRINEILKNSRYAFLAALISRPAGLLIFSVWIAHRWSFSEIALFESFSIFQFLLFFAWLPAWGNVSLMQTAREDERSQKSFLFSNLFFGWVLVTVVYFVFSLFWTSLLPGIDRAAHWITVYILILFYYFIQVHIYKNFIEDHPGIQWFLAAVLFLSWIVLGFYTRDFYSYMQYQVIASALILVVLKRGRIQPLVIQWKFWKQVMIYSVYSFTGGLGPALAAYFVQFRFGLGNELNWFRYGTRELPILPTWLAGFAQSHLKDKLDTEVQLFALKQGVARQIHLVFIPLVLLIVFSEFVFSVLFGHAFVEASKLMSIFLLIYLPRMIFSQVILQSRQQSQVLLFTGVIELVFMIAAALIWVPVYGLEALAWVLVVGSALEKLIHIGYLWVKYKMPVSLFLPVKSFLVFMIALFASFGIKSIL